MTRARIVAAFVVVVAAPWPAAAQPSPRLARLVEELEPYIRLVEQYRVGEDEQAIRAIREFSERSRDSLERALEAWKQLITDRSIGFDALIGQRPDLKNARDPRAFESAALLHTVVGMLADDRSSRPILRFHLMMARRVTGLRDAVADHTRDGNGSSRAFDAEWNWAVAVFFHSQWALDEAKPYMDDALARASADGELLLAAARLFEAMHSDRTTQLAHGYDPGVTQSPRMLQHRMIEVARAKGDITRAETLLRAAITAGARPQAAKLRLGRILQITGRSNEASTPLREVIEQAQNEAPAYLARLFLARMFEEQGESSQAITLYEAATRLCPRKQSARIALARLMADSGRREEAHALVLTALTTERERQDEPWWAYYYPDESDLSAVVAKMRERLR